MTGILSYSLMLSVVAIFLVIIVILALFIGFLPVRIASKFEQRYGVEKPKLAELEATTRAALGQVAVGLTGFFVLLATLTSIDYTSRNLRLTEQGQLADRFSRAIGLLNEKGTSDADINVVDVGTVARVGGIFALDRIVDVSREYREPTLHVLAAMIQREAPRGPSAESDGAPYVEASSGGRSQPVSAGPTSRTGPREGDHRFRPCDWLDAHPGMSPYAPGPAHEALAPDVTAALTVIGRLVVLSGGLTRALDLSRAELCLAYVPKGKLAGVWFRHSDLRGAILDEVNLTGAELVAADLTGAHLPRARLVNSRLAAANLSRADLCDADLSGADLRGAKLEDANLSGAYLEAARNLTKEQLVQACGSDKTHLPPGWQIEDCTKRDGSMWKEKHKAACSIE